MGYRPKPSTDSEAIEQLWYAVIGTNGDGFMDRLCRMEESFRRFQETREQTCLFNRAMHENKERKKTLWDRTKFLVSEGIRIGTALGIFELIRRGFS